MKMNYIYILLLIIFISGCDKKNSDNINNDNDKNLIETTKNVKTIIVGVNFNNIKLIHTEKEIISRIFGNNKTSVNNYYIETSHKNFSLSKVSESQGENNGFINININDNLGNLDDLYSGLGKSYINQLIISTFNYIDINSFDENNDGVISRSELNFIFIFPGNELSYDSSQTIGVWGQSYYFLNDDRTNYLKINNKIIKTKFSAISENHTDSKKSILFTAGILAHELIHSIYDFDDLYPSNNNTSDIKVFGLMGSGSWNFRKINNNVDPGNSPFPLTSYYKIKAGWLIPKELKRNENLNKFKMYSSNNLKNNILKILYTNNEYFLIENISKNGYSSGLNAYFPFTGGIKIEHIKEDDIKKIEIEYSYKEFNYSENGYKYQNNDFTWGSNEIFNDSNAIGNSKLRNNNNSGISITNINQNDDDIIVDVFN